MSAIINSPDQFDLLLSMSGIGGDCSRNSYDCETGEPSGGSFIVIPNDPVTLIDNDGLASNETIYNPLLSGEQIRLKRQAWNDPLAEFTPFRYPNAGDLSDCSTYPYSLPIEPCLSDVSYIVGEGDENGIVQARNIDLSVCKNVWAYYSGWRIDHVALTGLAVLVPALYARIYESVNTDCSSGSFSGSSWMRLVAFAWPLMYDAESSPWDENRYFACEQSDPAIADPMKCSGWSVLIMALEAYSLGDGGTLFYGQGSSPQGPPPEEGISIEWSAPAGPSEAAPGLGSIDNPMMQLRRTATFLGDWGEGTVTLSRAAPECS